MRSIRFAFAAAAVLAAGSLFAQPSLIITQIVDGDLPGGLPKALEITNIGDAQADLTQYKVANATNGAASFGTPVVLSGTLDAGSSFVICSEGTTSASVIGAAPDLVNSVVNLNGDDVIAILDSSDNVVDVWGELGVDGTGTAWETLDSYATRLHSVTGPTATFNTAEWNIRSVAALDTLDLAAHQAILGNTVPDTGLGNFSVSSVADWQLLN